MIGVVGGAKPVPEEEAVLWSCSRLIVCKGYEHWTVCQVRLEECCADIWDINAGPLPQSYSPFAGFHMVCTALVHPLMSPNTPVYCAFMDLYAEALGTDDDTIHRRAHDRALHALMFQELKRVHGDRLIFPKRLSEAVEKLSGLTPSKVRIRSNTGKRQDIR